MRAKIAAVSLALAVGMAAFDALAGAQTKATAAASTSTGSASRDVCALMSTTELSGLTGLRVERAEKTSDGCRWFANAADQQQHGQNEIQGAFEKLTKQEPASAEDGARTMEGLLKGIAGLASSSGPFLTASMQWTGADEAETTMQTTISVIGGGLPGGKLERIEGLGDRAYMGPAGSLLYVRKGNAWLELDLRSFSGSREQAIQIARQLILKM